MRAQVVLVSLIAAFVLSGPALAGSRAELELPPAKTVIVLDGRVWSCADRVCHARGDGRSQSLTRECARVARKLGLLSAYARYGISVDEAVIAVCNKGRSH